MRQNYKKSILGLNTVKAFIVVLLSLSIIAIITLVVLGTFVNLNVQTGYTSIAGQTTTTVMNTTATYVASTNSNCKLSVSSITNSTGSACSSGNYTVSGCTITGSGASGGCNNSVWLVTGSYTDSQAVTSITQNTSSGIIQFFTNSATFFALLGVVVIILIISLVVVVVNRFGGEAGMGSSQESL